MGLNTIHPEEYLTISGTLQFSIVGDSQLNRLGSSSNHTNSPVKDPMVKRLDSGFGKWQRKEDEPEWKLEYKLEYKTKASESITTFRHM